jgi:hypothetical protein
MTQFMRKSFPVPFMGRAYGEGWERTFGKDKQNQEVPVREYNGSRLSIKMVYHGYSEHRFHVELVGGEWPSDNDLITLCDGDMPPHSRHFGGRVSKSTDGKAADVTVYVD